MKKTQNGMTPVISEEEASVASDWVRFMAIHVKDNVDDWNVVEGYAHPQNVASLVFEHYSPFKGWEVSFYREVEDGDAEE